MTSDPRFWLAIAFILGGLTAFVMAACRLSGAADDAPDLGGSADAMRDWAEHPSPTFRDTSITEFEPLHGDGLTRKGERDHV